jgi:hypothetical protein
MTLARSSIASTALLDRLLIKTSQNIGPSSATMPSRSRSIPTPSGSPHASSGHEEPATATRRDAPAHDEMPHIHWQNQRQHPATQNEAPTSAACRCPRSVGTGHRRRILVDRLIHQGFHRGRESAHRPVINPCQAQSSATSKIRAACSVCSVRFPAHRHARDRRRGATGSHAVAASYVIEFCPRKNGGGRPRERNH